MKLVYEHENAQLWYDPNHKILKAIWFGEVGFEAFANLLTRGAQVLNASDYGHIIFDRRELNNFSAEARIWFKQEFMKKGGDGRRLIKKVRKIAAVKGTGTIGQLASAVFGKILLIFNPKLKYRVFENNDVADLWVKRINREADLSMQIESKNTKRGLHRWLFNRNSQNQA